MPVRKHIQPGLQVGGRRPQASALIVQLSKHTKSCQGSEKTIWKHLNFDDADAEAQLHTSPTPGWRTFTVRLLFFANPSLLHQPRMPPMHFLSPCPHLVMTPSSHHHTGSRKHPAISCATSGGCKLQYGKPSPENCSSVPQ